jgi:hypothetical protein
MMIWMVGNGSSVKGAPRAMSNLGSASRAQLLPSLLTTTTFSLGLQEPITGRVSHFSGRGERESKLPLISEMGLWVARDQSMTIYVRWSIALGNCHVFCSHGASTHMNGNTSHGQVFLHMLA